MNRRSCTESPFSACLECFHLRSRSAVVLPFRHGPASAVDDLRVLLAVCGRMSDSVAANLTALGVRSIAQGDLAPTGYHHSEFDVLMCCERNWMEAVERAPALGSPRVVILTPSASRKLWCEALEGGASDLLAVPFGLRELRHVLLGCRRRDAYPIPLRQAAGA